MNTLSIDDCVAHCTLFDLIEDEMRLYHLYSSIIDSDLYSAKERAGFRSCELSHWKRIQMLKSGIEQFEAVPPDDPTIFVLLQVWLIGFAARIWRRIATAALKGLELDLLSQYQLYWRLNDSCGRKWKKELLVEQNLTYGIAYANSRETTQSHRKEVVICDQARLVAYREVPREC